MRIPDQLKPLWMAALAPAMSLQLAACGEGGDQNLWGRDFTKPTDRSAAVAITRTEVTGYWEGVIAMGAIRTKIEPSKIILALKCDKDGKIVSQGSASIALEKDDPARMILQEDLLGGKDDVCGFRFYKGNEFKYTLTRDGLLRVNFAGASVSQLKKLSDFEVPK
jgi:hypothetical protein